jgi:16S rRNA (cytosine1402-N4)-methyltransferase
MTEQTSNDSSGVKKRRIRYKGTYPRRFEEKYKELDGNRYSCEIQKVIDRGQTPVGTHRPICLKEILHILDLKPGLTGVDATLGFGGHTQEMLKLVLPDGKVFAIDVDPVELPKTEKRLRNEGFSEKIFLFEE